jgi:hypothetical protein
MFWLRTTLSGTRNKFTREKSNKIAGATRVNVLVERGLISTPIFM